MSAILGAGHTLMNLVSLQLSDKSISLLGVDIDARGNLTFHSHPDDHIQLDDILESVATASKKTKKETYPKEGYDLILFERHFFVMNISVITTSCVRSYPGDYTGGEG
tara:strand:+ start:1125 stop:1448 length:324 start_codon:yes stop_codon:yes gene_type:complete